MFRAKHSNLGHEREHKSTHDFHVDTSIEDLIAQQNNFFTIPTSPFSLSADTVPRKKSLMLAGEIMLAINRTHFWHQPNPGIEASPSHPLSNSLETETEKMQLPDAAASNEMKGKERKPMGTGPVCYRLHRSFPTRPYLHLIYLPNV